MPGNSAAYVGIDLGGTNVRVGAITPNGDLLCWQEALIQAAHGPEKGLRKITSLVASVCSNLDRPIAGIGIGATGPVERERGTIQNPYTLPTWENVDIVSPLRERFAMPVTLENDADAAALGEAWMGSGRGLQRLIVLTVGTGIGTALILNGKIYRGMGGAHPEGGHIIVDPSGPDCYCGARGCWESLASGTAIGVYARELAAREPSLLMQKAGNDLEKIDAMLVTGAAREGCPLSLKVIDRAATYLGLGLVSLLQLFLPDGIIFTGGVTRSFDLFEPYLTGILARHSKMSPLDKIPLQLAGLGQQAGIFGAARAAMLFVDP